MASQQGIRLGLLVSALLVLSACASHRVATAPAPRAPGAPAAPSAPGPVAVGHEQTGEASYGNPYHGRRAASGKVYDMNQMTAAHRTLPFGTRVRVQSLVDGSSVEVRINDRGPFKDEDKRILDLSFAAGKLLSRAIGPGVIPIRRVVAPGPPTAAAPARRAPASASPAAPPPRRRWSVSSQTPFRRRSDCARRCRGVRAVRHDGRPRSATAEPAAVEPPPRPPPALPRAGACSWRRMARSAGGTCATARAPWPNACSAPRSAGARSRARVNHATPRGGRCRSAGRVRHCAMVVDAASP
jgi:rare lipoprotein A